MKKQLTLLTLALASSLGFAGCVEEPTSVTIASVIAPSDCSPGGENYITHGTYDPAYNVPGTSSPGYTLFLNVYNSMPNNTAWASSSSSSSGSTGATFEPQIVENNSVSLTDVTFKCVQINEDEDGCKGKDPIKKKVSSFMLRAGGTAIFPVSFLESDAAEWGSFDSIMVDVQLSYHDTGVFKGKSSHLKFTIIKGQSGYFDQAVASHCKPGTMSAVNGCAVSGQGNPLDQGVWSCDSLDDDKGGGGGSENPGEED